MQMRKLRLVLLHLCVFQIKLFNYYLFKICLYNSNLPPLEPPTVLRASYGLFVWPIRLFRVSCHLLTSGILVVPTIMAPDFFAKEIHSASSFAIVFLRASKPSVCSLPPTQVLSFVVNGTPRKGFAANSSIYFFLNVIF